MARRTFRDRFFTPQVARALWSPSGILAAGAGASVGIVATAPLTIPLAFGAVGFGALAWAARVAFAIPRKDDASAGIDPFSLDEPWRTSVWHARKAEREFAAAVKSIEAGPLRDRLGEVSDRMATGVQECWEVARSGHRLTQARARIDVAGITARLSQLPTGAALHSNPSLLETAQAFQAQLDTARRMDEVISTTHDRLRLLDARLGELVTRVLELSARPQGLDELKALGDDVDMVVGEMEALRQAIDETEAVPPGVRVRPMTPSSPSSAAEPAAATTAPPTARPAPPALGEADPTTAIPTVGRDQPVAQPVHPPRDDPAPQTWPPQTDPPSPS